MARKAGGASSASKARTRGNKGKIRKAQATAPAPQLAPVIPRADEEDNEDVPLEVVFQIPGVERDTALAVLANRIGRWLRRLSFDIREMKETIAQNTAAIREKNPRGGQAVPFRAGMRALLDKVEVAFDTAAGVVQADPSQSHLTALMAELKRELELEDRRFRDDRRAARGAVVNADPTAATRVARHKEARGKAKAKP